MIEKVISENDTDINYDKLPEKRKQKYQKIWRKALCCPERYLLSVDVASPDCKDYGIVTKFNYEEYLKGNFVVESIEYF